MSGEHHQNSWRVAPRAECIAFTNYEAPREADDKDLTPPRSNQEPSSSSDSGSHIVENDDRELEVEHEFTIHMANLDLI